VNVAKFMQVFFYDMKTRFSFNFTSPICHKHFCDTWRESHTHTNCIHWELWIAA
jgi:hypothetical protein